MTVSFSDHARNMVGSSSDRSRIVSGVFEKFGSNLG